jgi:hypothetical protein
MTPRGRGTIPVMQQPDRPDPAAHEAREINLVIQRLQDRFPDVDRDRIRAVVVDAHEEFQGRPIRDFVPVFVERAARTALTAPPG